MCFTYTSGSGHSELCSGDTWEDLWKASVQWTELHEAGEVSYQSIWGNTNMEIALEPVEVEKELQYVNYS